MNKSESSERNGLNILFCGAFTVPKNGTLGGVLYACTTLLRSKIAQRHNWSYVDSSQPLPPPPLLMKTFRAGSRFTNSVWKLLFGKIDSALVFSPYLTMSLLEKLSICFVSGLRGKPTVISFRSEIKEFGMGYRLIRPFIRIALSQTSAILCQSNEARSSLIKLFPSCAPKIHVLPNWIEVRKKPTNIMDVNEFVQLTYMGWLEPIKDVPTLLRGLAGIDKTYPAWRLSICGRGADETKLIEITKELGIESKIDFLGWVDEKQKKRVLDRTDIFVMASLSEGMPNSLVEAMNYGIPIIATDVGGIPTLVQDGKNGLLFKPGNVDQLTDCLKKMISDKESRLVMSEANVNRIATHHNVEVAANKIISLLKTNQKGVS